MVLSHLHTTKETHRMIRQSSNFAAAVQLLSTYPTEAQQRAFAHGYNSAHGIACHVSVSLGDTVQLECEGDVLVEEDNLVDVVTQLALECEHNSRQFSPWEQVAAEINSSSEFPEDLWDAYEDGVLAAIHHDMGVDHGTH